MRSISGNSLWKGCGENLSSERFPHCQRCCDSKKDAASVLSIVYFKDRQSSLTAPTFSDGERKHGFAPFKITRFNDRIHSTPKLPTCFTVSSPDHNNLKTLSKRRPENFSEFFGNSTQLFVGPFENSSVKRLLEQPAKIKSPAALDFKFSKRFSHICFTLSACLVGDVRRPNSWVPSP